MLRFARLLAALVVLLGLLPCEVREAVPMVAEAAAACCEGEGATARNADGEDTDCCGTAACACGARALEALPVQLASLVTSYLVTTRPVSVERPTWNTGPPPTPPPIA